MTMKPIILLAIVLGMAPHSLTAQVRFATRNGHIAFFSATPIEDIEAHNRKVTSVWDASSGAIEFAVLIKAFEFEKARMQEHFNENYMDSNKYPKANFKGKLSGVSPEQLKAAGTYPVTVAGDLTIHGVTKAVSVPGTVMVDASGSVKATSEFNVDPEDHDIAIPSVVRKNIAETIKVTVELSLDPM
jgi:polyisoprenoid-binding protein YceI